MNGALLSREEESSRRRVVRSGGGQTHRSSPYLHGRPRTDRPPPPNRAISGPSTHLGAGLILASFFLYPPKADCSLSARFRVSEGPRACLEVSSIFGMLPPTVLLEIPRCCSSRARACSLFLGAAVQLAAINEPPAIPQWPGPLYPLSPHLS